MPTPRGHRAQTAVLIIVFFVMGLGAGRWALPWLAARLRSPQPGAAAAPQPEAGRWHRAARKLEAADREAVDRLLALPYLSGSRPAGIVSGVRRHDPQRAQPGLNFYTSGHEPVAILMDMQGRELHRWSYSLTAVWPDAASSDNLDYWRRARPLANGDVLAIFEGVGLIRVDASSRLLWAWRGGAHHDVQIGPDDSIVVLAREPRVVPQRHETEPLLEDFIVELDRDGKEIGRVSILRAFEESTYAALLDLAQPSGDIFHTNTVDLFDGSLAERSPLFARGNVLISVRELNTLAIVDLQQERVVWALTGLWRKQHESRLIGDGKILVFDNFRGPRSSAVLEIDPGTQQIEWQYTAPENEIFFSRTCGSNQRLANGDTLIVDSDHGRAFEVTPDGETVWEFISPHRAGANGEWIATLFDLVRLPRDGWRNLPALD